MQKSKFTLIVVLFFLFSCNSNSNETVKKEMTESDYDNLINVFEKYFGDYVILYK
jgi:hypothetical protein